jgi:hypothetical protein
MNARIVAPASAVEEAAAALLKQSTVAACLYIAAVTRMPSRQLSAGEKSELIADAGRVKVVIGCQLLVGRSHKPVRSGIYRSTNDSGMPTCGLS